MKKYYITLLILLVSLQLLKAQSVGLVLSGGGAKGLAHIGVIKALEENNIPIDYVAGTSMGAIIGSLYAIGYTPEEMIELVTSSEFKKLVRGIISDKYNYYYMRSMPNASMVNIKLAKRDSSIIPQFPINIINTSEIDFKMMEVLAGPSALSNYNFDSLMIPFRCVAANVFLNEQVIFRDGYLPDAVRASMTFPVYYRPIKINETLLFDGGIYNNFPADILVNDFSPDFLIGSKTADNYQELNENDILSHIENMIVSPTDYKLYGCDGFIIESSLKDIRLLDFHKAESIIQAGYNYALENIDSIKSIIYKRVSDEELSKKRNNFREKIPDLLFGDIYFNGLNEYQETYFQNLLRSNNHYLDIDILKIQFYYLLSDNYISYIYPRALYNIENKEFELDLDIKLASHFEVQFGGNISSSSVNQGFAGLEYRILSEIGKRFYTNIYFGRFYSSASLRSRLDFPSKLPFLIDGGLTLNRLDFFTSSSEPFFEDVRPSYLIQNDINFDLNVGFPIRNNDKVSFGAVACNLNDNYYQTERFLASDTADNSKYNVYSFNLEYEKNSLNYILFPDRGEYINFSIRYISGNVDYTPGSTTENIGLINRNLSFWEVDLNYQKFYSLNSFFNIGVSGFLHYSDKELGFNYMESLIFSRAFSPTPISKTMFNHNFRANIFAASGIKTIFHLSTQFYFQAEGYAFFPYRRIISNDDFTAYYADAFSNYSLMGAVSLIYQSPIGPASISLNYFDKSGQQMFFQFNFGYILFNKRGYR